MNYKKIYDELCIRGQNRELPNDLYTEKHHIVPRCMGGLNDKENLTILTPEEHYVCHQLLVKINPTNHKLIYAANFMCADRVHNKSYGWIRRKVSEVMSIEKLGKPSPRKGAKLTEETKERISEAQIGKIVSEETKLKRSKSFNGRIPWNKGILWSEESKKNLSESHIGHHTSEETKRKISQSLNGRKHSDETKQKMIGRKHSDETKIKMAEAKKNISEETRRKMSEARTTFCIKIKNKENII